MNANIKILVEAIENHHVKSLIETHVKELMFDESSKHLIIHMDNVAPLHELEGKEEDKHLNKGLAAVYGDDITYELRTHGHTPHERDKVVSRRVQW